MLWRTGQVQARLNEQVPRVRWHITKARPLSLPRRGGTRLLQRLELTNGRPWGYPPWYLERQV
jgi:hypothetical protein